MTPEGRVKKKVDAVLKHYGRDVYYIKPVPYGHGKSTVDYLVCVRGAFLAIETKGTPDGRPTARQASILEDITDAGGATLVVADDAGVEHLRCWMEDRCGR